MQLKGHVILRTYLPGMLLNLALIRANECEFLISTRRPKKAKKRKRGGSPFEIAVKKIKITIHDPALVPKKKMLLPTIDQRTQVDYTIISILATA